MEEDIKVEAKKNRWKKVGEIALALISIGIAIITKGKSKG